MSHSSIGGITSDLVAITAIVILSHHFVESPRASHMTPDGVF